MKDHDPRANDLWRLFAKLSDDRLSEAERRELRDRMIADREARRAYIHFLDMEAALRELPAEEAEFISFSTSAAPASRRRAGAAWAAAAALVAIAAAWFLSNLRASLQKSDLEPARAEVVLGEVAVITAIDGVDWRAEGSPLEVGARLRPSVLRIASGTLQVLFFSGATVSVEGPAEFHLQSAQRGFLAFGKLAANVPEEAVGFTIGAPGTAVVDLGTEFALNVDAGGDSRIHVFDGEVHASVLGEDGSTLVSQPVRDNETVEIVPGRKRIVDPPRGGRRFHSCDVGPTAALENSPRLSERRS